MTRKTKRVLWTATAAVALTGAGVLLWFRSGPEASAYANLAVPRITHLDDQRMLVVEAVGDPNLVAARAFELLFSAYYKADGVSRMRPPPAPRARWSRPADTPRAEWLGRYGLPVGEAITAAPAVPEAAGLKVRLETWEYGDVAQLLHVGPYSEERADIERLTAFVDASGYRVVGDHEEEYIRGPGMFFAGDPKKYLTIIRLRVASGRGVTID